MAEQAIREKQSHIGYLEALLAAELEERERNTIERRIREAHLPRVKTLEEFAYTQSPHVTAAKMRDLAEGGYIERAEPVLFIGECGTRKTHLLTGLCVAACRQKRRIRFTTAAGLVNELVEAKHQLQLRRVMARCGRYDLIAIDEVGYVPLAEVGAEFLFQVVAERAEKAAVILTTNLPFSEWTQVIRLGYEHDPQLVFRPPVIKALPEDNVREGFLEPDKYQLLLDALTDEIKPVFVVAYHLGMRTGELLALGRNWVDLEDGLIYVTGRVTKNRSPKTGPIYGDMKPWLEMVLSRGKVESPKCVWLFSRNGNPVKDFKADWKNACGKAGVPNLLFHDLRRTAVRNMIRAGVPEKIAMQISGHKTASMLWRYNITDTRDIKNAGKLTESYLKHQRIIIKTDSPTESWDDAECQDSVILTGC